MLTARLMIQAIADLLAGLRKPSLHLRDFTEPWRTAYKVVLQSPPECAQQALLDALAGRPDRDSIIGAIVAAVPAAEPLRFPSLEEIAAGLPPVTWLWEPWIPLGMLSLLGALPGAGKSFVALYLAWQIIADGAFPDETPVSLTDATVIYVDAEAVPQLLNERAQAWGIDRSRLFLMLPEPHEMIDFAYSKHQDQLIEMVHSIQPALIIVDSLSSITSRGENNVEDVRTILGFLSAIAVDSGCAVLLIHHLRKRGFLPVHVLTTDDFRGSSHIIAMARSVMGLSIVQIGPQPDRNGPRRLEIAKTNLARYPEPLGVEFLPLHSGGVCLQWGNAPEPYQVPTKQDRCVEWLMETLQENGRPMNPKTLVELAEAAGFSRAMVYRARNQSNDRIVDTEGRRNPNNKWALVGMIDEDDEDE
jgi:hypothetical protein